MAANPIFDEVLFPLGLSTGSTGGPSYKTSVIPAASGFEQRNAVWAKGRLKWTIAKGLIKPADRDSLIQFFRARAGRLRAFRFRDPFDNTITNQVLNYTGGLTFQLIKTYTDTANSETRLIKKPVAGTVAMTYDGGAFPAAVTWSVDATTGIGTLSKDCSGHVLRASCLFDTPARFDQDEMALNLQDLYASWDSVVIMEEFLP